MKVETSGGGAGVERWVRRLTIPLVVPRLGSN